MEYIEMIKYYIQLYEYYKNIKEDNKKAQVVANALRDYIQEESEYLC